MTTLQKATAVLIAERIEPALAFWKKLGLAPVLTVPEEGAAEIHLAFAILAGEGLEIMYQTSASVAADLVKPGLDKSAFRMGQQQTTLYVEVAKLADVEQALKGERLILPRRTTAYGATEAGYLDPAGHVIVFAERHG